MATLPAPLFEELMYGCTAGILDVVVPMRNVKPPKLKDGCDIGIDSPPRQQGALNNSIIFLFYRREGDWWDMIFSANRWRLLATFGKWPIFSSGEQKHKTIGKEKEVEESKE